MTPTTSPSPTPTSTVPDALPGSGAPSPSSSLGPLGRLGRWAAVNRRTVFILWAVLVVSLGVFAPKVEHALSGAGWQANGSESVQVRDLVQKEFGGLNSTGLMVAMHSPTLSANSPAFQSRISEVAATLKGDDRVSQVVLPPRRPAPSAATVTPSSSWPARPRTATTWSAPPTTSRTRCARWATTGSRSR